VIGWPCFLYLACMAYPVVRLLYGPQWMASIPLARILCGAGAIAVVFLLATEVLIARGDAVIANYLQAVSQVARIAGVLLVIPFGLEGACWGILLAAFVGAAASQYALRARLGLTLVRTLGACKSSLAVAIISAAPALGWAVFGRIDEANFAYVLFVTAVLSGLLWLAAVWSLRHPAWNEICTTLLRKRAHPQATS
jgi:O-antigen/teichoic acid export membrane protein